MCSWDGGTRQNHPSVHVASAKAQSYVALALNFLLLNSTIADKCKVQI